MCTEKNLHYHHDCAWTISPIAIIVTTIYVIPTIFIMSYDEKYYENYKNCIYISNAPRWKYQL